MLFLRRDAKNSAAAIIMIRQPPIVKIVVPIPPVDGRDESVVSIIVVGSAVMISVATPSCVKVTDEGVSFLLYPCGAVFSLKK